MVKHKCEECDETIPIHIEDYKFPRTDFKAYCKDHIKVAPIGTRVFEVCDDSDSEYPKGYICGILGPETNCGNTPNIGAEFKEYVIGE